MHHRMQLAGMSLVFASWRFRLWSLICFALLVGDLAVFYRTGGFGLYSILGFMVLGFPVSFLIFGAVTLYNRLLESYGFVLPEVGVAATITWMIAIWLGLFVVSSLQWFWLLPALAHRFARAQASKKALQKEIK
jgi:hypothetical protein